MFHFFRTLLFNSKHYKSKNLKVSKTAISKAATDSASGYVLDAPQIYHISYLYFLNLQITNSFTFSNQIWTRAHVMNQKRKKIQQVGERSAEKV